MRRKEGMTSAGILITIVVIVLLLGVVYLIGAAMTRQTADTAITPVSETEEKIDRQTTALAAVGSFTGSGTASRELSDGRFEHKVEAILDDPSSGKFYEGWLVRGEQGDADFDFISTGRLEKDSNDRWRLSYKSSINYFDYNGVVITEETIADGLDGQPEEHVLEGSF
jgi:hypothetical protein